MLEVVFFQGIVVRAHSVPVGDTINLRTYINRRFEVICFARNLVAKQLRKNLELFAACIRAK